MVTVCQLCHQRLKVNVNYGIIISCVQINIHENDNKQLHVQRSLLVTRTKESLLALSVFMVLHQQIFFLWVAVGCKKASGAEHFLSHTANTQMTRRTYE